MILPLAYHKIYYEKINPHRTNLPRAVFSFPLSHLQFFVLAEDLGKSLSGLHKARCRMDEVTGLQSLTLPSLPSETSAWTKKGIGR